MDGEMTSLSSSNTEVQCSGKLTPRVRDLICHYFYLLGLDANDFCKSKPADYKERDISKLTFLPPPAEFNVPLWSILFDGESERPSNSNKRRREKSTSSESESDVQEEEGESLTLSQRRMRMRRLKDQGQGLFSISRDQGLANQEVTLSHPRRQPRRLLIGPRFTAWSVGSRRQTWT